MDDEDKLYDIHPLDRDYSDDADKDQRGRQSEGKRAARASRIAAELPYQPKVRFWGAWGLLGGLGLLFLSSVAVSNFPANSAGEQIAGFANRMSMFVMLIGGLAIVIAYRLPQLSNVTLPRGVRRYSLTTRTVFRLLMWNVVGFLIATVVIYVLPAVGGTMMLSYYAVSTINLLLFAFAVTLGFWSVGAVRAYGIALAASMYYNYQSTNVMAALNMNMMNWGFAGGGQPDPRPGFLLNLTMVLACGFICAVFVAIRGFDARDSEGAVSPAAETDEKNPTVQEDSLRRSAEWTGPS